MKKMVFDNMKDLQKTMDFFEKYGIEYSWHFMNKKYELHLGSRTTTDQIKSLMQNADFKVPFKWGDYYW